MASSASPLPCCGRLRSPPCWEPSPASSSRPGRSASPRLRTPPHLLSGAGLCRTHLLPPHRRAPRLPRPARSRPHPHRRPRQRTPRPRPEARAGTRRRSQLVAIPYDATLLLPARCPSVRRRVLCAIDLRDRSAASSRCFCLHLQIASHTQGAPRFAPRSLRR